MSVAAAHAAHQNGLATFVSLSSGAQSTAGTRQDIKISMADDQLGETSRIAVAGAAPWLLCRKSTPRPWPCGCKQAGLLAGALLEFVL